MAAAIRNRHPAPTHRSMTLAEARAGLHSHACCDKACEARQYYNKAVREIARGPSLGWNVWTHPRGT